MKRHDSSWPLGWADRRPSSLAGCGGSDNDHIDHRRALTKSELDRQGQTRSARRANEEINRRPASRSFTSSKTPSQATQEQFATDTIIPNVQSRSTDQGSRAPSGDESQVKAITDAAQSALDKAKSDPTCSRIRAIAPIRSLRRTSWRTPMASTSAVAAAANRTLAPNAYAKGAIGALRPSRTDRLAADGHLRPRPHLDRRDRGHGPGSRRAGRVRRGRRHRLRLDARALPQLGDPGDLARGQDREGRRGDRHRLGVHA